MNDPRPATEDPAVLALAAAIVRAALARRDPHDETEVRDE